MNGFLGIGQSIRLISSVSHKHGDIQLRFYSKISYNMSKTGFSRDIKKYHKLETLGKGTYGKVYKTRNTVTN